MFNFCRTSRYQGRGYYVSLVAEARAIRDDLAKSLDVYAYFNNDIGGHAVHNARDVRRYVEETGARAVA